MGGAMLVYCPLASAEKVHCWWAVPAVIFPGSAAAGATQGEVKPVPVLATNCACGTRETLGPRTENDVGKKGKATLYLAQGSVAVRSTCSSRPRQGGVGRSTSLLDPRRGRSRSNGCRFLAFLTRQRRRSRLTWWFCFLSRWRHDAQKTLSKTSL